MHKKIGYFIVGFVCLMGLVGCSTKSQEVIPEPVSMPLSASFEGVWYSPQFEHMYLTQKGDTVLGIYTFKEGGEIKGKVEGNLLTFEWIEPGDSVQARRTLKGHGYLQLKPSTEVEDEYMLEGRWGYDDSVTLGGPWRAKYVRLLKKGEPVTLKEWKNQGRPTG